MSCEEKVNGPNPYVYYVGEIPVYGQNSIAGNDEFLDAMVNIK